VLRRLFLLLPALALIGWLVAAQLPRWTAPYPYWFAPNTPGVCAAVASLTAAQATRGEPSGGIGRGEALTLAQQIAAEHYDPPPNQFSDPLGVYAALPGDQRRPLYLVTAHLGDAPPPGTAVQAVALIYVDAASGDPVALITATNDATQSCDFDMGAALKAAVKSPPLLLLAVYTVALILWFFLKTKGWLP
jgi:hypothetical protein